MAATPTIVIGRNNWGVKNGNLLGYYQSDDSFFVKREFAVTRGGGTNGTFIGSNGLIQTAASGNIPRIDFTGGSRALLVEPAATNSNSNSNTFSVETAPVATVVRNQVDPFGNPNSAWLMSNADSASDSASANNVRIIQSVLASNIYTCSIYVKSPTGSPVTFRYRQTAGGDINGSTVVSGSEFQRIQLPNTNTATSSRFIIYTTGGVPVIISCHQVEVGSVATSYIPTTTGTVTRNTDSVTITGATDYIGQTEGTIYLETDALISGPSDLFCFARATANTISISKNSSNIIQATVYTSGPSFALNIAASATVSGNLKIAVAYKTGDSALYINGVQIGTSSTAFSFTAALTQININPTGSFEGNGNQRISTLSIYNTRLSNAELATLTIT
jgi:hypothetical protein